MIKYIIIGWVSTVVISTLLIIAFEMLIGFETVGILWSALFGFAFGFTGIIIGVLMAKGLNKKYYFRNSFTTLVNGSCLPDLEKQLKGKQCCICGADLVVTNMLEGTVVLCTAEPWKHQSGYDIDMDFPERTNPPKIVKKD